MGKCNGRHRCLLRCSMFRHQPSCKRLSHRRGMQHCPSRAAATDSPEYHKGPLPHSRLSCRPPSISNRYTKHCPRRASSSNSARGSCSPSTVLHSRNKYRRVSSRRRCRRRESSSRRSGVESQRGRSSRHSKTSQRSMWACPKCHTQGLCNKAGERMDSNEDRPGSCMKHKTRACRSRLPHQRVCRSYPHSEDLRRRHVRDGIRDIGK
mmetsp:Transcript_91902/g.192166  ORF Transcript_91902/g.192166 Transcript_91902/m.192166 type:complete len:208 (+) Transcript_91902:139-762(+)